MQFKLALTFLSLLFLLISHLTAQQRPPLWLKSLTQSDQFYYYIGIGEAKDRKQAVLNAYSEVLTNISTRNNGLTISVERTIESLIENSNINGVISTNEVFSAKGTSTTTGAPVYVEGLWVVDEYVDPTSSSYYKIYLLVREPKRKSFADAPVYQPYGKEPLKRSLLFPGLGQKYKGRDSYREKDMGNALMYGEIGMIATATLAFSLQNYHFDEAFETLDRARRARYLERYEDWRRVQNVALGGIVTLYAVSLLDIWMRRDISQKFASGAKGWKLEPSMEAGSMGLCIHIRLN
ncbi:MAG: hypothetical protein AAFW00_25070 [Bacteroidota bacterium]